MERVVQYLMNNPEFYIEGVGGGGGVDKIEYYSDAGHGSNAPYDH